MGLRVRIEHGQDAGKTFRLPVAGAYRFGRTPQASIQILDMKVSKDHFEIVLQNGTPGGATGPATIRDLGSSHGTLLNAQKVTGDARPLSPGDEIRLGLTVLRVLSDGPGDADAKPTGPPPPRGATTITTPSPGPAAGNAPAVAADVAAGGGGAAAAAGARPAPTPARRALPPDALVGTTLAGYKILEKVGAGGMGAVYRAEQLSLHREVALKVLAEKLVSDSAFVDQFVNEARAAGQLNHPNVVQVYDVGHAEGRHFFSMEFIHGGPLEGKIQKGQKPGVPWQDALGWFLDAANALIFAEKKGILHRDIKPDNFMLSADGSVKLCDLGLAKKSESADLLAQGIIGTPHFISPEAIRRRTDVDRRSDLYSLGCTFYRLLTGKNPYPAASVKEILLAHLNAPVPRASASVSDLPKELDEVVFKLMQKDPAARFQNAEELWGALDKIRLQFGLEAHGLHPGRAKRIAILAASGGLIAVGVAAWLILNPKEPTIIEKKGDTVIVGNPEADRLLKESTASNARLSIENDAIRLGELATAYANPAWDDIVRRYEELGADPQYQGTPSAEQAAARAKEIKSRREQLIKAQAEFETARKDAESRLETLGKQTSEKMSGLGREGKVLEADDVARDAAKKIDELEKEERNHKRLVQAALIEAARTKLAEEQRALSVALGSEFEKAREEADAAQKDGTAAAIEKAIQVWTTWKAAHPAPEGREGDVATAMRGHASAAQKAITDLEGRLDGLRLGELRADRADYHGLLLTLYLDRSDASAGGLYPRFRFGEAVVAASARAKAAKTQGYRDLAQVRHDQANRLAAFLDRVPKLFQGVAIREPLTGTGGGGWKATVKDVNSEGVLADGVRRAFADESLGFFLGLFYDAKGKERMPLDADAHEALAILSVIGVSVEGAEFVARFEAEAKKTVEADPARAPRMDALRKEATAEAAARALWDEAWKTLSAVNAEMVRLHAKIDVSDEKASKAGRDEAIAKEADLQSRLQSVRTALKALESDHPSSIVLAAHVEAPPAKAAWAGETPPPIAAPPAPPTVPPAPPTAPEPAMDEAPAMKDEAGAMNDDGPKDDAGMK
jgi:serine/threonine-protein kinase